MKAAKAPYLKKAQSRFNEAMRLNGKRDGIMHPDQVATPENQVIGTEPEPLAWLDKRGRVIEPLFADYFLERHPMRCFHNKLFTVDGMIGDETILKKEIFALIKDYVKSSVARKTEQLLRPSNSPARQSRRRFRRIESMWRMERISWTAGLPPIRNTA